MLKLRRPLKHHFTMLKEQLKTLSVSNIVFDYFFITLSFYCFYHSIIGFIIGGLYISLNQKYNKRYSMTLVEKHASYFVDFLNILSSNLSTGMTYEMAILKTDIAYVETVQQKLEKIKQAIQMGSNIDLILKMTYELFPIPDTLQYVQLIKSGHSIGVKPSFITSKTLALISFKQQINNEIKQILYQKQLEQRILSFAPIAIIFIMIQMSPGYLDIMYTTLIGRTIMTLSFLMVLIMNKIASYIIKIEV